MGRIEGPPVGEISESMQKRRGYIKGVPVLKPANVELVRAGEEKTMREIADLMTCSKDVISGRLRAAGTPTRRGRRKIKININLLARQYIAEEMSADEIAKPLDISAKTVLQR